MKTIVISGGTDGMGKALALTYLNRGDTVIVLGRDADKGKALLAAGERAIFVRADLSLVAENTRIIEEITAKFPVVDALVLCARHFRSTRLQTAEGFENTFALEYLSRFLLSHGLAESLERAEKPVIVNVSGPGVPKPEIHWDDLGLARGYDGVIAQIQAGRANDLRCTRHRTRPARRAATPAARRRPSPIPRQPYGQVRGPALAVVEAQPSGIQLAFRTTATTIELEVLPTKAVYKGAPAVHDGVYDLLIGGRLA